MNSLQMPTPLNGVTYTADDIHALEVAIGAAERDTILSHVTWADAKMVRLDAQDESDECHQQMVACNEWLGRMVQRTRSTSLIRSELLHFLVAHEARLQAPIRFKAYAAAAKLAASGFASATAGLRYHSALADNTQFAGECQALIKRLRPPEQVKFHLENPKPITIESIVRSEVVLTLVDPSETAFRTPAGSCFVCDGERRLARLDELSLDADKLPLTVAAITIKTSDGRETSVFERNIAWHGRDWRHKQPWLYAKSAQLRPWTEITWDQAQHYTEGQQLSVEYPMQWVEAFPAHDIKQRYFEGAEVTLHRLGGELMQVLTNGELFLPEQRPRGSEWKHYRPLSPMSEIGWSYILRALKDSWVSELLEFQRRARKEPKPVVLTAKQKTIRAAITASMYGGQECKVVAGSGKNVIFIINDDEEHGRGCFLVDNADPGALYQFTTYAEAEALACGTCTRSEAIEKGIKRLIHAGQWEMRVAEIVSAARSQSVDGTAVGEVL